MPIIELGNGTRREMTAAELARMQGDSPFVGQFDAVAAREAANHELASWLDAQAAKIIGIIPETEKFTWAEKEVAARKIKAGTATPEEAQILEIESALAGETLQATADKVLLSAAQFRVAGPVISGVRRYAGARYATATTAAQLDAITAKAKEAFSAIMANPAAFLANPRAWIAKNTDVTGRVQAQR